MADWLQLSGAMTRFETDHHNPSIEIRFPGGRQSHVYAGSANIRIFFAPRDYQTGLMFLLKFRSNIYNHNLPSESYDLT